MDDGRTVGELLEEGEEARDVHIFTLLGALQRIEEEVS